MPDDLGGRVPHPITAEAWGLHISRELDNTRRAYLAKPAFLIADARRERQTRNDYAKRELLELLQNAADAAAEAGGHGRVLLEARQDGLLAANTGAPFRTGGVDSLMTANLSDKPNRATALIGAKGLGFRALLNWTQEPFILSGALSIGFTADHALSCVEALAAQSDPLARELRRERNARAPILAFPHWGPAARQAFLERRPSLLRRADELRAEGFDTVVVAPFNDPAAFTHARQDLGDFRPELLLFVRALDEIELRAPGRSAQRWRKTQQSEDRFALELTEGDTTSRQSWICRYAAGELPEKLQEEGSARRFELAIGLRTDAPTRPQGLHAYFPTSVRVPLPALFHASLELSSNRKLFTESKANGHVLEELAKFYPESLEALADAGELDDALAPLKPLGDFPDLLAGFEEALYEAAEGRRLVRTFGGERLRASEARIGPDRYWSFLPPRLYPQVAVCGDQETRATLVRLGAPELRNQEILTTLRKAKLGLEERARVVAGVAAELPAAQHDRRLLIDSDGRPMRPNNVSFPPSAGAVRPTLPRWASARFLDRDLWVHLSQIMGGGTRERIRQLQAFGVEEYSLEGVVRSLVRRAEQSVRREPRRATRVRRELLGALFRLYVAEADPPRFPQLTVYVQSRAGEWRAANQVHLSDGYGLTGSIIQELYRHAPHLQLAPPGELGLPAEDPQLTAFAGWLGVHAFPREVGFKGADFEHELILSVLPETFDVTDKASHRVTRAQLRWGYGARCAGRTVEDLPGILANAPSEAVVAWLARDPRLQAAGYAFSLSFEAVPDGKQSFRSYSGPLPDPVRARLRDHPWLQAAGGGPVAPGETMLDPGRLGGLFARPAAPRPEFAERLQLEPPLWTSGLLNAGVATSLAALGERAIYRLLMRLPERSLEPEVVRALYLQVLSLEDFDPSRAPQEAAQFKTSGRVLVRQGGRHVWVPPAQAAYADRDSLPLVARDPLALIELPTRRNANDVLERFGVEPLSRREVQISVVDAEVASVAIAEPIARRYDAALPFIAALRRAVSQDKPSLRRLERLRLQVCSRLTVAIRFPGQEAEGPVPDWSHLLLGDDLYIVVRDDSPPADLIALAGEALADGLADLFELQGEGQFAKLLQADTDSLRSVLVRRALQNLPGEEVDALLAGIEKEPAAFTVDPAVLKAANGPRPSPAPSPQPPPAPAPPPPNANAKSSVPQTLVITPLPAGRPAAVRTSKVTLKVVGATPSLGGGPADPSRSTDAEDWAECFERSSGRFPLKVAHLVGAEAFGCDVLSFQSAADRDRFRAEGELKLVARFIEVKSGQVALTDNELRRARLHRSRYFIYRVAFHEGGRETATLTSLSDPANRREALQTRLHVNLDRTTASETFLLSAAGASAV